MQDRKIEVAFIVVPGSSFLSSLGYIIEEEDRKGGTNEGREEGEEFRR